MFGLLSSFVSCIKDMSVVLIILVRRNSLLEKVWLLWRRPLTLIDAILSEELVIFVCRRDVAMFFFFGAGEARRVRVLWGDTAPPGRKVVGPPPTSNPRFERVHLLLGHVGLVNPGLAFVWP